MFIEQFAYQVGCSKETYSTLQLEYSEYLELIKPQIYVCQCGHGGHPDHNRYNHQVLAGLIGLTLLSKNDTQRRSVVSSLLIHDYGHMAFSHEIEKFIRDHIDKEYTHIHEVFLKVFSQVDNRYKHLVESEEVDLDRLSYLMLDSHFLLGKVRFTINDIVKSFNPNTLTFDRDFVSDVLHFRSDMYNSYYSRSNRSREILESNRDIIVDVLTKNYHTLPIVNGKFFTDVELMSYISDYQ